MIDRLYTTECPGGLHVHSRSGRCDCEDATPFTTHMSWSWIGLVLTLLWYPFTATATVQVLDELSQRTVISFNGTWRVEPVPPDGSEPLDVAVPGDLPIVGGVLRWSRTFTLEEATAPSVAWLEFGGASTRGVVRLNGTVVGELAPFTRTRLDVLEALDLDGQNTLEIELDDRVGSSTVPGAEVEDLIPLLGLIAHTVAGPWEPRNGIVRDISLHYATGPVVWDARATATLDSNGDEMVARLQIAGTHAAATQVVVGLVRDGNEIASAVTQADESGVIEARLPVPDAVRWSPQNPALYDLIIIVLDEGEVVDAVYDQVGFRKFEVIGNRFHLNGAPIFLRGVTRHGIYPVGGFVATDETMEQDLLRMKSLGINFVRTIHYPVAERFVRMADRIGMLISEEIPAWALLANPSVREVAQAMLLALIERDYNRPSVIAWLAGTSRDVDAATSYFESIEAALRTADPTRPLSFTFDDRIETPQTVADNLNAAIDAGMDFASQAGYWDPADIDAIAAALPPGVPVLMAEWTGTEGSNRGPIGEPGFISFGSIQIEPDGTGIRDEMVQAEATLAAALPWFEHLLVGPPVLAGMVYYNWQDVAWSGTPYVFEGHHPALRTGLVYEDRAPKLALDAFALVMQVLEQIDAGAAD